MKDKISVIIPVYNAADYLGACMDSVLAQQEPELEIILVDDGSTDESGTICERYRQQDSRVQVLHRPNGGAAAARNAGLAQASGTLIAFVDADDRVCPGYFSILARALRQADADVCICAYLKNGTPCLTEPSGADALIEKEHIGEAVISQRRLGVVPWGKLFTREIIGETRFMEGRINEDDLFCMQVYARCKRILKLHEALYCYTENENGVTYSDFGIKNIDILPISLHRLEVVEQAFSAFLPQVLYNAACSFIDVHARGAQKKLFREEAFARKLLEDREALYRFFCAHKEQMSALINKKIDFYYRHPGKIMQRDRDRFLRYKLVNAAKRFLRR